MSEIVFTKAAVNLAGLYAALATTLTGRVVGIGVLGDVLTVVVLGEATDLERMAIEAIVTAHNPDAMTPDQATDATARTDIAGLLAEIAAQRAALLAALAGWAGLSPAEQIAVLRRDTAILERLLAVLAYLLRRWPL